MIYLIIPILQKSSRILLQRQGHFVKMRADCATCSRQFRKAVVKLLLLNVFQNTKQHDFYSMQMAGNIIWPITHEAEEFENGSSSSKKKTCTQ